MKFFVPYADSDAQAKSVIDSTCKHLQRPVPKKCVYSLAYVHNSMNLEAQVGKTVSTYYNEINPTVLAILPGDPYLICLQDRGIVRGDPILVSQQAVTKLVYFD